MEPATSELKRSPMRVYEIAKEVGIPNKELLAKIRALGLEVNNHMSSLNADDVARIKKSLEKERMGQGPQETHKLSTGTVLRRRSSKADEGDTGAPAVAAPTPAPAPVIRRRVVEETPPAPPAAEARDAREVRRDGDGEARAREAAAREAAAREAEAAEARAREAAAARAREAEAAEARAREIADAEARAAREAAAREAEAREAAAREAAPPPSTGNGANGRPAEAATPPTPPPAAEERPAAPKSRVFVAGPAIVRSGGQGR
ncbi:MAG TPA: translation initiation factor IF-2 N-terminal domain-containing protein, partial [Kofleriaceae bacterium]|nr:translation initiation factor IF-2 N-terminal domain-containing protein [Kofleriaceae bacterium]